MQIDFHDTSRGPRVPSMNDHFGFTMASLNEKGSVFANPCKGEKNMSTLMYRPFSSWANNSEVRSFNLLSISYSCFPFNCYLTLDMHVVIKHGFDCLFMMNVAFFIFANF